MKNILIKSTIILFTFLFLSTLTVSASSHTIDFSKKGSIKISILDSSDASGIENVEVSIYKIANADKENYNLVYKNISELNECGIDLSTITDSNITDSLVACVKEKTSGNTKNTDNAGLATFNNLDLGLYLIIQTNKVVGYSTFSPFLVLLPQEENNSWVYDVEAMPKTDIYKVVDINVKKEWNSEGKSIPESITVELLNNNEVIDTVILNNRNDWNYTWYDIQLSDKYSVSEVKVPTDYAVSYRQEGYNFIVTNTRKLPQTGLQIWVVDFLAIAGVISLIVGIALKKKYENN